ncbi:MAG: fatty-acid oxidation protein subunit alpha [Candidatus Parabeggiatoa sp. nov. 1]|nr:MAG: fatty-acid oxidation protein subunit alpha [Gammaproteobacteria bacterium]
MEHYYHDTVKNALTKKGWTITEEPLSIRFGGVDMYVDLGIGKIIAVEKAEQKIAVEIKSFSSPSILDDFHLAVGQFMNYRLALEEQYPQYILYLAVPVDTYDTFFTLKFTQLAVQRYQLKLIIYDTENEEIVKWQM